MFNLVRWIHLDLLGEGCITDSSGDGGNAGPEELNKKQISMKRIFCNIFKANKILEIVPSLRQNE